MVRLSYLCKRAIIKILTIESMKSKLDESRDTRRKRTKIDEFKEPVINLYLK